mmetsp:Transcript_10755/g.25532  ORF Transcript_10755/g.25532 Transcript_10755/m.25532 type:complete len:234 (-) Transcript_10755:1549-2250(-)
MWRTSRRTRGTPHRQRCTSPRVASAGDSPGRTFPPIRWQSSFLRLPLNTQARPTVLLLLAGRNRGRGREESSTVVSPRCPSPLLDWHRASRRDGSSSKKRGRQTSPASVETVRLQVMRRSMGGSHFGGTPMCRRAVGCSLMHGKALLRRNLGRGGLQRANRKAVSRAPLSIPPDPPIPLAHPISPRPHQPFGRYLGTLARTGIAGTQPTGCTSCVQDTRLCAKLCARGCRTRM